MNKEATQLLMVWAWFELAIETRVKPTDLQISQILDRNCIQHSERAAVIALPIHAKIF